MIRVTHFEPDSALSTGQVAVLIGQSRRNVLRIPQAQLDYWRTMGGEHRQHRRYEARAVAEYAREYLGLTIQLAEPPEQVAQG